MIITGYNPSTDNLEKTYLSTALAVGAVTLVVRNNDRFSINDRILIGEMGREQSEIVTVSAVNSNKTGLTVGATKFPHSADDAVYVLSYDQIKFYRSTTTVDGTYSNVATVDVDVDNQDNDTLYNDLTGISSYFYKITYYNSVGAIESSLSDPIPGTGYTRDQVGSLAKEFLEEIGDVAQQYITIPQIIGILNECNDDLQSQSRRPYRFLKNTALLTMTADNDRIPLPDDLLKYGRISYNYDLYGNDRTDDIRVISIEEMEYIKYDNSALANSRTIYVAIDETTDELVLYPTPADTQVGKIKLFYWKKFASIDSLGDAVETPTPRIYKLFLMARHYRIRGNAESSFLTISDRYVNDYNTEVVKLQRDYKVDVGTPMSMKPDTRHSRGLRF